MVSRSALRPDLTPLRGRDSRGFRAVFTSRTVAMLGSQAAEVALLVQAKQLTGSPLIVGLLGMAELVPLVVFGLYGGALADRLDRRALMRRCEPGLAGCAGLLLVNALLPRPAVWPLFAVSALMMAFASVQRPSFEAAIPRIVPREQFAAAAAVLSMSTNASVLLGSSLGGVLAVAPGPWLVYALDAAAFTASFIMLGRLPRLPPTAGEAGAAKRGSAPREIAVGLRYAVSRRDLLGSYLADLSAMIFAYPNALFPFMAVELHAPWATGLMFAAPSAGAFAVSVTSGWMGRVRRHGRAIAAAAAAWGLAMAGFGLSPDVWAAIAFLVIAGAADELSAIFRDVMWNQSIPDELRGRMAGIELLSYAAGPPAGQLRSGIVASVAGVRFSLTTGGLACVAAVGVVWLALPPFRAYIADAPRESGLAWSGVRAVRKGENVALRAAVVGGGLGGMAAAVALAQAGIDVQVHEQAQQLTEVGAGVSLAPNGLRMAERLGIGDGIGRVGARYATAELLLSDGRPVRHEPAEFVQPGRTVGIHRADLLTLLAGQLPAGTVRTGHRCTAFSQDDGSATVGFADGTTATADMVIGADGMHSVLQGFVVAPAKPVFSEVVAYRGLVPRPDAHPADAMRMWVGEGRHFLVYPVRAGQLLNYVGFVPSDTSVRESWSAPGDPAALAAAFAGWDPAIGEVIAAISGPGGSGFRWGMYDRAPLPRWSSGRLTLLGDAAHPMLPHLAQGVNQALEDAVALATLLGACAGPGGVPRALAAYEELRRDRTARIQLGSRRTGAGYDSSGSQLTDRRWIYEYDAWAEAVALT